MADLPPSSSCIKTAASCPLRRCPFPVGMLGYCHENLSCLSLCCSDNSLPFQSMLVACYNQCNLTANITKAIDPPPAVSPGPSSRAEEESRNGGQAFLLVSAWSQRQTEPFPHGSVHSSLFFTSKPRFSSALQLTHPPFSFCTLQEGEIWVKL